MTNSDSKLRTQIAHNVTCAIMTGVVLALYSIGLTIAVSKNWHGFSGAGISDAYTVISIALLFPIVEELIFREFPAYLSEHKWTMVFFTLSFCVLHLVGRPILFTVLTIFPLGLALLGVRMAFGKYYSIATHITYNMLVLLAV